MPSQNTSIAAPISASIAAPIIGYHRAPLSQKFGAPRQPNLVAMTSIIEMLAPYDTPDAFIGLADFSHLWITWQFHHNYLDKSHSANPLNNHLNSYAVNNSTDSKANAFRAQVRPPRLGGNQKIGVFASRSMYRPSNLGLSVVKLEKVEIVEGRVLLLISGADMIDGTPIIDIKPYVAYSDALIDTESGFATAAPERLKVSLTQAAYNEFMSLVHSSSFATLEDKGDVADSADLPSVIENVTTRLLVADIDIIKALIAQDPRPAYRRTERNTVFTMRYKSVDISFMLIESGALQITSVRPVA